MYNVVTERDKSRTDDGMNHAPTTTNKRRRIMMVIRLRSSFKFLNEPY